MNLFKIVQKRTDKSNAENKPYRDVGTVLLFVFLLPYVISCLWGNVGEETESISGRRGKEETDWIDERYEISLSGNWGIRKMSMQEYLIRKLEVVLGKDDDDSYDIYELETLKAQAVLLRTELWELILSSDGSVNIQDDVTMYESKEKNDAKLLDEEGAALKTLYEQAVTETDGIYLTYENHPIKAAYFPVSNGHTRSASEVWENADYPYLLSVECSQDITASDYQSRETFSKDEYCRIIQEIFGDGEASNITLNNAWDNAEFIYDSAGYVLTAEVNGSSCNGEAFRNAFNLSSASFNAEWSDSEVIFHVKGLGHGFGMSQYGANVRAVSGETFDEILKYYFFNTELAKIE